MDREQEAKNWERNIRAHRREMQVLCAIATHGKRNASPLTRVMIVVILLPMMKISQFFAQRLVNVLRFRQS